METMSICPCVCVRFDSPFHPVLNSPRSFLMPRQFSQIGIAMPISIAGEQEKSSTWGVPGVSKELGLDQLDPFFS